jgi:hypothetical protein
MSTALVPIADLERMAVAFAKSGMFGAKTPEQAMALLLLAQAEGVHPAIAMRDFDVIQGKPAKKAEAMQRSFLAAGGKIEWHKYADDGAAATFSHEQGGSIRVDWDVERAKKAGLASKDMYGKFARQMFGARVISEGVRKVYPAATSGLYEPGEVRAMQDAKPARRGRTSPPPPSESDPSAPAERDITNESEVLKVTPEQIDAIKFALLESRMDMADFLTKADITDISELAAADAVKGIEWIRKQKKAA